MIVDDIVMIFKSVHVFPDDPFARDILYMNACMWIYNKIDGVIGGIREDVRFRT